MNSISQADNLRLFRSYQILTTKLYYIMQTKEKKVVIENASDRYVVMRNGARVSDEEYANKDAAKSEYDHWTRIITRWPDGSKLEIVNLSRRVK